MSCKKCKDENGYLIFENNVPYWKICECVPSKRLMQIMKSSEITEEMRNKTFDNFEVAGRSNQIVIAKEVAKNYCIKFEQIKKERNNSFVVLGQVGSGKTHLLFAVSNALLSSGIRVVYFPYVEGINNLKSNFDEIEEKINRLKKIDVLFIDDFFKGREKPTAWQVETMFSIINYRYLNHLPILLTSEKDFDMLLEIDEAIGSRLYEMSKGFKFVLKGKELNNRLR